VGSGYLIPFRRKKKKRGRRAMITSDIVAPVSR
jgi:hypothetical protein